MIWSFFAIALTIGTVATAATFTASLDRSVITLGESVTLSLACEGGQPEAKPVPPDVANLQMAYVGPSSHFSVIHGQVSSSITYNFRVTASQPGDYLIPAVTTEVGGQKLTSQPLQLRVVKPTAPPPGAATAGSQLAFMRLVLPKKEIYVGESVVGQIQLYLHSRVRNISGFQITGAPDGLNIGKLLQGQRRQVQTSNVVYTMIPLQVALTAVKAGTFPTASVTATAVLEVQSANRRRDPFFDQFGMRDPLDMFGGGSEQQQVTLVTESEAIQLLPLPKENMPPTFNGAVGSYTMNVSAGPTNVTAGDPITVRVQILGNGSIDNIALPEQPGWGHFKMFPPTSKVETTDQLGLQGSKTFEQIVSPENADINALPPIAFCFFDPQQKQYRTLTQPPLPLLVRPGALPAAPTTVANSKPQDNSPTVQDIVPNKQRIGALARIGSPLIQQAWFVALQCVPLLALVTAVVWRRRADNLARNPQLRRRRDVAAAVAKGLAQLRSLAAERKSEEFFMTVFRLLQEQLGERVDMPASAITEAIVEERLRPGGAPESVLGPLQELFHACNVARYAPIKSSQELEAVIPKLEKVLGNVAELTIV